MHKITYLPHLKKCVYDHHIYILPTPNIYNMTKSPSKFSKKHAPKWFTHPCVYPFVSSINITDELTSYDLKPTDLHKYVALDSLHIIGYIPHANIIYYLSMTKNTIRTTKLYKKSDRIPIMSVNPLKIKWIRDPFQYSTLHTLQHTFSQFHIGTTDEVTQSDCIGYRLHHKDPYHKQFHYILYFTTPKEGSEPISVDDLFAYAKDEYHR